MRSLCCSGAGDAPEIKRAPYIATKDFICSQLDQFKWPSFRKKRYHLCVGRPVIYLGSAESEIGQIVEQYRCGDVIEDMGHQYLVDAILKYRHDGQAWFEAQEGAVNAAQEYNPRNSLNMWMDVFKKVLN